MYFKKISYGFWIYISVFIWMIWILDTLLTISLLLTISQNTSYWQTISSPIITTNFLQSCSMGVWGDAYDWLASFPFLVYSKRYDSVFCLPCTLFDKSEISQKSKFSKNTGFSSWFKISEKVSKPLSCEETCEKNISNYSKHSLMMTKAEYLIQRFQNPTATNFEATREIQNSKNRQILKWLIKTIILYGKQCIALRGHLEDIHDSSNNCGNFFAILKLLSETNSDLKHHLVAPSVRNTTYIYLLIFNMS